MTQRASAAKTFRRSQVKHGLNKSVKSRIKTETKKFNRAIGRGSIEDARPQLDLVTKLLHQAASKGVIHKNTAARRQAKLQSRLDKLSAKE